MGQAFYLQFACKIWHNKVITPPPRLQSPVQSLLILPCKLVGGGGEVGWWRGWGWMVEGVRLVGGGGEVGWWRGWGWMVEGVRLVGGGGEVGWWRGWGWLVEGVRLDGGGGEVGWWRGWGWNGLVAGNAGMGYFHWFFDLPHKEAHGETDTCMAIPVHTLSHQLCHRGWWWWR